MKMSSKINDTMVLGAGLSRVRYAVAAALWLSAQTALAQTAPAEAPADDAVTGLQEMVVTGTRVVRDGYSAPTPVSVISTEELRATAPANITDFVNTLPSVAGSSTPANTSGSVSPGGAGIAALDMLQACGVAGATVSHLSARIGDCQDTWDHGVVSHANARARELGIVPGQSLRECLRSVLQR